MRCQFCELVIDSSDSVFACRFCGAEYEQRVDARSRVLYEVVAEPDSERYNLVMVKKRLRRCWEQVMTKPGDTLALLEDTWVELATLIGGTQYKPMVELIELRRELAELREGNGEAL